MYDSIQVVLQHPDFPKGRCWWLEEFAPGATIIEEGDRSRDVYLVLSGKARVNKLVDVDDDLHIQSGLSDLSPGDTFGELNLFDNSARCASIVAESIMEVARLSGPALSSFLDSNPDLGYCVLKDFYLRHASLLRAANKRVSGLFAWGLKQYGIDQHLKRNN